LCSFRYEAKFSESMAEKLRVKEANSVCFLTTSIEIANLSERFNVPQENPGILVFFRVN